MTNYMAVTKELAGFYTKIADCIEPGDLSPIWISNAVRSLNPIISSDAPFDQKLRQIHADSHYSLQMQPEVIKSQNRWWVEYLKNRGTPIDDFPKEIEEAAIVGEDLKTKLPSGRHISPDFMRRLTHVTYCREQYDFPKGRFNVLELGAGYCGFARLFKMFHKRARYFVIDIPHTLYFGAGFIKACFPEAKILLVGSAEEFTAANLDSYDFIFIPSGLHRVLHGMNFELFVNTHSMGEMPNHVVERWFDLIQNKAHVQKTFMLNRFLNRNSIEWRKTENKGSVSFDPHWNIKLWEFEPPFMRCPYTETIENQCVLVMAERIAEKDRDEARYKRMATEIDAYVINQDWFRFTNSYNPFRSLLPTYVSPERVQDFTMNGTLFHLWNSVRLYPTQANTIMMVQYLRYINLLGPPFEEFAFYRDLHLSLPAGPPAA